MVQEFDSAFFAICQFDIQPPPVVVSAAPGDFVEIRTPALALEGDMNGLNEGGFTATIWTSNDGGAGLKGNGQILVLAKIL